jgi:hypothetical protein
MANHIAARLDALCATLSAAQRDHIDSIREFALSRIMREAEAARDNHGQLEPDMRPLLTALSVVRRCNEILMASADPVERRIVALPVWRFISNDGGPIRVTHNVFDVDEGGGIIEWTDAFPENAVIQVPAVGTGCMLIHRTVLEDMQQVAIANGRGAKWCWFAQQVYLPADVCEGEDIWFCRLAAASGIPVWINTSIVLQHAKTIMLQGPAPEGSLSIGGEPGWFYKPEAPAPEPEPVVFAGRVAVIVPVLRRPQNAAPFMRSLLLTTEQCTVYAIADDDDVETADAWRSAGATVVPSTGTTFAIKVNDGFRAVG